MLNLLSIRRNQVASMENSQDQHPPDPLQLFQTHVAQNLANLIPPSNDVAPPQPLLSIPWLRKLLDSLLFCDAQFRALLLLMGREPAQFSKPPLDRLILELQERAIKSLDICNAVTHAVDSVRHWQKLAEIAVTALNQRPIVDGHVRRAKKALTNLLASINADDKENQTAKSSDRAWSFGRRSAAASLPARDRSHSRSSSLSFANSWSSAKQIQLMTASLVAPRGGESVGLVLPVYIMSTVLSFGMWALVAALPCQDRTGLPAHFAVPKQFAWAQGMIIVQEKIGEEWKKKEKKGRAGLLEETVRMEKVAVDLMEFAEGFEYPVEGEEVEKMVGELEEICGKMEEGLVPLQQQVREVFHGIVKIHGLAAHQLVG